MRPSYFAPLAVAALCLGGCSGDEQAADGQQPAGNRADLDASSTSPQGAGEDDGATPPVAGETPPSTLPMPDDGDTGDDGQAVPTAPADPEVVVVTIDSPPEEIADFLAEAEQGGQITLLAAFRASMEEDPARAVDVLAEILESDSRETVRRAAIGALAHRHLRGEAEQTVPILVTVLDDPDADEATVLAAIQALRRIGPGAEAALPRLRELAEDDRFAEAADEAIARIERAE